MSALGEILLTFSSGRSGRFTSRLRRTKLTLQDFPVYKRSLIAQGRSFCNATAPQCREKIAALAVDFLSDDATVRLLPLSRGAADLVDLDAQLLENRNSVDIESTCPEQAHTSLRNGSSTIMSRVGPLDLTAIRPADVSV